MELSTLCQPKAKNCIKKNREGLVCSWGGGISNIINGCLYVYMNSAMSIVSSCPYIFLYINSPPRDVSDSVVSNGSCSYKYEI